MIKFVLAFSLCLGNERVFILLLRYIIHFNIMELTLKQRYLQANSPISIAFDEERTRNFDKLLVLISSTDRTRWLSTGFNCGLLIQSYKQVYGLTSQQFETLISLLANIGLK